MTGAVNLSDALGSGQVSEGILRQIAHLGPDDLSPVLEREMLMALSDTSDARLRNVLAVALSGTGSNEAAARIVELLTNPKTSGSRGTLLYALQRLGFHPSPSLLVSLILFDTPEAAEEAFMLLEEGLRTATRSAKNAAMSALLDSLGAAVRAGRGEIALDTFNLLLPAVKE